MHTPRSNAAAGGAPINGGTSFLPLVVGEEASAALAAGCLAPLNVVGSFVVQSGNFFLVSSRGVIYKGVDIVASWNYDSARLIHFRGKNTEGVTVIPYGAAVYYGWVRPISIGVNVESELPNFAVGGSISYESEYVAEDDRVPVFFVGPVSGEGNPFFTSGGPT